MNAYVVVDDELKPGKPDAVVRQPRNRKRVVRVADIHHHLGFRPLIVSYLASVDLKRDIAVVNIAPVAFRTRNCDLGPGTNDLGRISRTDNTGNSQLAADDGTVTRTSAAFGDDGRRPLHDRLPRRVGHRRHKDLALLKSIQLRRVKQYMRRSLPYLFADRHTRRKRSSVAAGQAVAFNKILVLLRVHRFGACL